MPIYEYACGNCGHQFETLQGIKDAPLVNCEQCHQPTLVKLVSAAGFRLKGGGWYETDFKSGTDKKRNLTSDDSHSNQDQASGSNNSGAEKGTGTGMGAGKSSDKNSEKHSEKNPDKSSGKSVEKNLEKTSKQNPKPSDSAVSK